MEGDNGDIVYQLKRIADSLEKLNRKLDEMSYVEYNGGNIKRALKIFGRTNW